MSDNNDFGKRLKQIRKSKGLAQAKLAELAGVHEKHISKIETGVYFPTYATLNKILKVLDVKIDEICPDFNNLGVDKSEFYIKSLQILNNATSEQELEYYYGQLKQAQKGISILKK